MKLSRGCIEAELHHASDTTVVFRANNAEVIRSWRRRALLVLVRGRLVAELSDEGALLLAGTLIEEATVSASATLLAYSPSLDALVLTYGSVAIAFTNAGDLLTPVPLAESTPTGVAAPESGAAALAEGAALGGLPPDEAALLLTSPALLLRGTLSTHQTL